MSSKRSAPRKKATGWNQHDRKPHIQFKQTTMELTSICKHCHCPFNGDGDDCGLCTDPWDTLATLQEHPHWTDDVYLTWYERN